MWWFYCIPFIEYMIAGKTLLDYTNLFSLKDYKKNRKIIYMYFRDKYGKRNCKPWRWNKIDWTRNYILEKRQYNDLMSGNHEKVCRVLNYFKRFLVFVSAVSERVSNSVFTSLVGVTAGIENLCINCRI